MIDIKIIKLIAEERGNGEFLKHSAYRESITIICRIFSGVFSKIGLKKIYIVCCITQL